MVYDWGVTVRLKVVTFPKILHGRNNNTTMFFFKFTSFKANVTSNGNSTKFAGKYP